MEASVWGSITGLVCVISMFAFHLASCNHVIDKNEVTGTGGIVAKITKYAQDCIDDKNAVKADGAEWRSDGVCDQNHCHQAKVITYSCRQLGESENPDPDHCGYEGDLSLAFPLCCPELRCQSASVTVAPAPACADSAASTACETWKTELGGCDNSSPLYNITSAYCRLTCNLCN